MFCPLSIILVQLRVDPVLAGNDGLLAVVADYQWRNAAKIFQGVAIDGNPRRLLGRDHSLCIDVLRIRENRTKTTISMTAPVR